MLRICFKFRVAGGIKSDIAGHVGRASVARKMAMCNDGSSSLSSFISFSATEIYHLNYSIIDILLMKILSSKGDRRGL